MDTYKFSRSNKKRDYVNILRLTNPEPYTYSVLSSSPYVFGVSLGHVRLSRSGVLHILFLFMGILAQQRTFVNTKTQIHFTFFFALSTTIAAIIPAIPRHTDTVSFSPLKTPQTAAISGSTDAIIAAFPGSVPESPLV